VRMCVRANWGLLFIVFHMFAYKVRIPVKHAVKIRLISYKTACIIPLALCFEVPVGGVLGVMGCRI